MNSSVKCLLIDDEPMSVRTVKRTLKSLGHQFTVATSQQQAWRLIAKGRRCAYDYVLLDLKLKYDGHDHDPDSSVGLALLKQIRGRFPELPVLVISAYEWDMQMGIDLGQAGATAYVEKGSSRELLKKISDLLKSPSQQAASALMPRAEARKSGHFVLEIDENQPNVMKFRGRAIDLSKQQYEFMLYMAQHPGRNLRTDDIIAAAWKGRPRENQRIDSVRNEINRRVKAVFKDFKSDHLIVCIRAAGWKLNIPATKVKFIERRPPVTPPGALPSP